MLKVYRYVIDHDMGFAPNPFYGVCTLATCKPVIRKCASIGDFVLGFGSAKSEIRYKLIYWLKVDEIIKFDAYWNDVRFQNKKPIVNGSHHKFHGDNIYGMGKSGSLVQAHSFHSMPDGSMNMLNFKTDTGSTHNVLIGREFGYYGEKAIELPHELREAVGQGRPVRVNLRKVVQDRLVSWLLTETDRGLRGKPSGWASIK